MFQGRGSRVGIAAVLLLSATLAGAGQDPPRKMTESELKAGFLYNFAKYVEWPLEAFKAREDPIVIGIVGVDSLGQALEKTLKDRTAQDRKFTILRFPSVADLKPCHILFVSRGEADQASEILKSLGGAATLTVGESPGFSKAGGMVTILIENERPKLEINPDAATRTGLTIQARLLKLATLVKSDP